MLEKINCPFCDEKIDNDSLKCPNCNALFKEPVLKGISFNELVPFSIIDVLAFGFFSTIWFFINFKAINKLTSSSKDGLKMHWLIFLLGINAVFYMLCYFQKPTFLIIFSVIQCFIYIALTYRVLRIIQKYTSTVYNVELSFNRYYLFFFNIFYLIHFIETYTDRVFHTHEYFDVKSPQTIFLLIILLILLFFVRFYNEMLFLIKF